MALKTLKAIDMVAFAELVDASFTADVADRRFPPNGSFVTQKRGDREYVYFRGFERSPDGSPGRDTMIYVGPVDDSEVQARVNAHSRLKQDYRKRRDLAAKLRRAGLPAPLPLEGMVISKLSDAGMFQYGAVLVGSLAFQTYGGLLGARFADAQMRTQDLDLARGRGVALPWAGSWETRSGDRTSDLLDVLKEADPSFAPIHDQTRPDLSPGFRNASGFSIEFLTTAGREGQLAPMRGLGKVGAQPLPFMDFLIEDPVRSVSLYDAGVPVLVPSPERFAVHKLIVATRRRDNLTKSLKDVTQADSLIEAIGHARRDNDLGAAWAGAWQRGPKWRQNLAEGAMKLSDSSLMRLAAAALEYDSNVGFTSIEPGAARSGLRKALPSARKVGVDRGRDGR